MAFWFTDGTTSHWTTYDQNGQPMNEDGAGYAQAWQDRRVDLSPLAGKTISLTALLTDYDTPGGDWTVYYRYAVLVSADGTVHPIYTRQSSISLITSASAGTSNVTYTVNHAPVAVTDASQATEYYHGDQIGSSRLMTSGGGWPVWQGTFLPYGEEYNAQIGTNHYKFTGKERDDESGLDYFGARYYGSALGRFITPDWAASATAVPYAEFADPQSLNLYTYVRNIPTTKVDADGHDCPGCINAATPIILNADDIADGLADAARAFWHFMTSGPPYFHGPLPRPQGNCICPPGNQNNNNGNKNSNNSQSSNAAEQGRDAQGKFLPKNGSEAAPGSAAEREALDAVGATKNTQPIPGSNRIPDGTITNAAGKVVQYAEGKSGAAVSNTAQLRQMARAAMKATGKPLKLVTTNPNVKISSKLEGNANIEIVKLNQK
ncbi:MAG TPA: RHS repeat-associated core domain-containing protein [Candidatus Angelobacter sp.]|nr:RHS repeat-associated core domain-containing protein [Candidatus Angelobacter sp.]